MTTSMRAAAGQQGFTLIEVLVAMVILAIGLLGLEALGISGARAVALAERNSRAVASGGRLLEDGIEMLRRQSPVSPPAVNDSLANGDRVVRTVCYTRDAAVPSHVSAHLRVIVTPRSPNGTPRSDTLSSYVFVPRTPSGATISTSCS